VALYFLGNVHRGIAAHARQLVVEVAVERLEPGRHIDMALTVGVEGDVAPVDAEHVRAFDGRLVEIFVGRVGGIVYFVATCTRSTARARDVYIAYEMPCPVPRRSIRGGVNAVSVLAVAVEALCGAGAPYTCPVAALALYTVECTEATDACAVHAI